MKFKVADQIFETFPGVAIGIVVIKDTNNQDKSAEVASMLKGANSQVKKEWTGDKVKNEPKLIAWREAYSTFKAKPKKNKCSIENLYKMILGGRNLSPINNIVDLYNVISLKYCLPVGGEDIDSIDGDVSLCFAEGDESFIPLGSSEQMPPKPGEVVYKDSKEVLCRRWNWRESDKTKITENSKNVVLVIEGLPPVEAETVRAACNELAESLLQHCGGQVDVQLIDTSCREVEL